MIVVSHEDDEGRALPLLRSMIIPAAFRHGFTTRAGGVSAPPYDTLFDAMSHEIDEGRALFKSRVTPEIYGQGHYDRALCDVMLKSKGNVKSRIW